VFISAAGEGCQCQVRFLISFRSRGHQRASGAAAAINTGRWWPIGLAPWTDNTRLKENFKLNPKETSDCT